MLRSHIKGDLRRSLSARLFALGPVYTCGERSGELVNTLGGGVESLDDYITQYLPARYWAVFSSLLIFLAILWIDPPTTLILLFAAPMLILLLALIGGQAQRLTQKRFAELSWMSAFYLDILQGLPTLKLFGRSREQAANIECISRRYGDTTLQVLATAFQSSLVMEWAATAATAMVALEVSLRLVAAQHRVSRGAGRAAADAGVLHAAAAAGHQVPRRGHGQGGGGAHLWHSGCRGTDPLARPGSRGGRAAASGSRQGARATLPDLRRYCV